MTARETSDSPLRYPLGADGQPHSRTVTLQVKGHDTIFGTRTPVGLRSRASAGMDPGRDATARCSCRAPTAPRGRDRGEHRANLPAPRHPARLWPPLVQLARSGCIRRVLRAISAKPRALGPKRVHPDVPSYSRSARPGNMSALTFQEPASAGSAQRTCRSEQSRLQASSPGITLPPPHAHGRSCRVGGAQPSRRATSPGLYQ